MGVAARLTAMETKAVHTYCYCHALNLISQGAIRNPRIIGDGLDTVYEISKLIKKSLKHDVLFPRKKDDVTTGPLHPASNTIDCQAGRISIHCRYHQALQQTWDAAKEATKFSEF